MTNGVAIADVNRDGNPDVIVAGTQAPFISAVYGSCSGTFAAAKEYVISDAIWAEVLGLADFNGDSYVDVVAQDLSHTLWILTGNRVPRRPPSLVQNSRGPVS